MAEQYNDAVEKLKDPELRKKFEKEQHEERERKELARQRETVNEGLNENS